MANIQVGFYLITTFDRKISKNSIYNHLSFISLEYQIYEYLNFWKWIDPKSALLVELHSNQKISDEDTIRLSLLLITNLVVLRLQIIHELRQPCFFLKLQEPSDNYNLFKVKVLFFISLWVSWQYHGLS